MAISSLMLVSFYSFSQQDIGSTFTAFDNVCQFLEGVAYVTVSRGHHSKDAFTNQAAGIIPNSTEY